MTIPINQIIAFTAVARTNSFAQAAVHLHLSQPALSISIKNLETSLGGKLLLRTTRTVSLTPEGKAFYPVAKRLLSDWEQAIQDVRNHFALLRGKLNIAAMPTYATNVLPSVLAKFHTLYPDINVTVHDVIAENVVEMVRENRCELGITFLPSDILELNFEPLYNDKFIVILPSSHVLVEKESLTWSDILQYPHISLQRPAGTRAFIDKELSRHNVTLTPVFESHQLVSIGKMVSQELGLSVVPSTSKAQMIEMGLQWRELSTPNIVHQLGVITCHPNALSAAAQALLTIIREHHS